MTGLPGIAAATILLVLGAPAIAQAPSPVAAAAVIGEGSDDDASNGAAIVK